MDNHSSTSQGSYCNHENLRSRSNSHVSCSTRPCNYFPGEQQKTDNRSHFRKFFRTSQVHNSCHKLCKTNMDTIQRGCMENPPIRLGSMTNSMVGRLEEPPRRRRMIETLTTMGLACIFYENVDVCHLLSLRGSRSNVVHAAQADVGIAQQRPPGAHLRVAQSARPQPKPDPQRRHLLLLLAVFCFSWFSRPCGAQCRQNLVLIWMSYPHDGATGTSSSTS
jgi:hypothetical protein